MKVPILRLSSVLVKIFQIPLVIFQTTNQFFFKFCMTLQWKITTLYFFRPNVTYFAWKGPIKVQICETFECSNQNSPNSCRFWNSKLVSLHILHHYSVSWDITPLYFLAEILYTFSKRSLSKYKFGEISPEQTKVWNFVFW